MDDRYKRLGTEKKETLDRNFDEIYEKYKEMAKNLNLVDELKFVKEKNNVTMYALIKKIEP